MYMLYYTSWRALIDAALVRFSRPSMRTSIRSVSSASAASRFPSRPAAQPTCCLVDEGRGVGEPSRESLRTFSFSAGAFRGAGTRGRVVPPCRADLITECFESEAPDGLVAYTMRAGVVSDLSLAHERTIVAATKFLDALLGLR